MIRVLDLPGLLSALEPVFDHRVAHSEWGVAGNGTDYALRLASDEGAATLRLAGQRVRLVDERAEADDEAYVPLSVLNPLVTGIEPRRELLTQQGVLATVPNHRLSPALVRLQT